MSLRKRIIIDADKIKTKKQLFKKLKKELGTWQHPRTN